MRFLSKLHPIVNLIYYLGAVILTCVFLNPFLALISFIGAVINRRGKIKNALIFSLPLILMTAVINPIINTRGETVLFNLMNARPITLEAVIYGLTFAIMLGAVVVHFISFSQVFTSDKILYLFSPIAPALSLIFSLTLKLIPSFAGTFKENLALRQTLHGESGLSVTLKALSATVSHTMESSMVTAESMKARGFGNGKRTSFALYRFTRRDGLFLAGIIVLIAYVIAGGASGVFTFTAFPSLTLPRINIYGLSVYLAFTILVLIGGDSPCHR